MKMWSNNSVLSTNNTAMATLNCSQASQLVFTIPSNRSSLSFHPRDAVRIKLQLDNSEDSDDCPLANSTNLCWLPRIELHVTIVDGANHTLNTVGVSSQCIIISSFYSLLVHDAPLLKPKYFCSVCYFKCSA